MSTNEPTDIKYKWPEKHKEVNGVMCFKCGHIVVSWHRHDFKMCACRDGVFIDGGREYTRYGGNPGEFMMVRITAIKNSAKA